MSGVVRRAAAWVLAAAAALATSMVVFSLTRGIAHPRWLAGAAGLALGALAVRGSLRRRAPLTALFATLALLLLDPVRMDALDTRPTAMVPFAILRTGRIGFASLEELGLASQPYWLVRAGGSLVSRYPIGSAILTLPVFAPAALGRFDLAAPERLAALEQIAAAALTACGVALLYLALRRLAGEGAATWACSAYVLGTGILPCVGQRLWQHTGAVFALSAGVAGLVCTRAPLARGALVGFAVGVAVACRPVDALLAVAFLAAVAWDDRRALPSALLGLAAPLALAALYNARVFGNALATGYGSEAAWGWRFGWLDLIDGEPGILISPARGLLVYSPVLLLAIAPLWRASGKFRILLGGAAAYSLAMGGWWAWHGGSSPGPRMLADTLPVLALGLALAVRDGVGRRAFLALLALSMVPNLLLAYVPPSARARSLVFDRSEADWSLLAYAPLAYLRFPP
jgi:hypothetical protein